MQALVPIARAEAAAIDPDMSVNESHSMADLASDAVSEPRFRTLLLGTFASLALALASIGVFGVLSYFVTQRTREIGIRMALGATPRRVLELIVSEGMRVVLLGLVIGLAGGLALGRTVQSLVYDVGVRDPKIYFVVAASLTAVALAACFIPARRAAVVDPMVALREE